MPTPSGLGIGPAPSSSHHCKNHAHGMASSAHQSRSALGEVGETAMTGSESSESSLRDGIFRVHVPARGPKPFFHHRIPVDPASWRGRSGIVKNSLRPRAGRAPKPSQNLQSRNKLFEVRPAVSQPDPLHSSALILPYTCMPALGGSKHQPTVLLDHGVQGKSAQRQICLASFCAMLRTSVPHASSQARHISAAIAGTELDVPTLLGSCCACAPFPHLRSVDPSPASPK
jgi:hypothetical protein